MFGTSEEVSYKKKRYVNCNLTWQLWKSWLFDVSLVVWGVYAIPQKYEGYAWFDGLTKWFKICHNFGIWNE